MKVYCSKCNSVFQYVLSLHETIRRYCKKKEKFPYFFLKNYKMYTRYNTIHLSFSNSVFQFQSTKRHCLLHLRESSCSEFLNNHDTHIQQSTWEDKLKGFTRFVFHLNRYLKFNVIALNKEIYTYISIHEIDIVRANENDIAHSCWEELEF